MSRRVGSASDRVVIRGAISRLGCHDEVEPADLGVSPQLTRRLRDLARRWDDLSARWVNEEPETPESEREEGEWSRDRLELAYDLRNELGGAVEVLVAGFPLREARHLRGDQWTKRPPTRDGPRPAGAGRGPPRGGVRD